MADRIFFATSDDGVSSSGFNGFPFALPSTAPSPQTTGPNPVAAFWIVKEWFVEGDSVTTTLSIYNEGLASYPSRERDLLFCPSCFWTDGSSSLRLEMGADFTLRATFFNGPLSESFYPVGDWNDSFAFGEDDPTNRVNMAPSAFWPYANSNGDPIYDGSGGQIRDPRS